MNVTQTTTVNVQWVSVGWFVEFAVNNRWYFLAVAITLLLWMCCVDCQVRCLRRQMEDIQRENERLGMQMQHTRELVLHNKSPLTV